MNIPISILIFQDPLFANIEALIFAVLCLNWGPLNLVNFPIVIFHYHIYSSQLVKQYKKGSIWEGVQVTRETYFKRNLLS